jgi:transcriptional regulator with XRE-family HTH domain
VARLSHNVRHYRRAAGLSQLELARKAGVGASSVARIEGGHMENPRVQTVVKLARALGIEPRDLMPDGE